MKKTHIIGIIVIASTIAGIMGLMFSNATYGNFSQAFNNEGSKYEIKGKLNKNKNVTSESANLTTFFMIDDQGVEKLVKLNKSKPQDFDRSEGIVVIGKAKGDVFFANDILMKCPSKYNEKKEIKAE